MPPAPALNDPPLVPPLLRLSVPELETSVPVVLLKGTPKADVPTPALLVIVPLLVISDAAPPLFCQAASVWIWNEPVLVKMEPSLAKTVPVPVQLPVLPALISV